MWRFHLDNIVRRTESDAQSVHSSTSRSSASKKNSRLANIQTILSRRRGSKGVSYSQKCPGSEPESSSSESTLSHVGQTTPFNVSTRVQIQTEQTITANRNSDSASYELECPLCLSEQPREAFPVIMTCEHRSCRQCLRHYLEIEITESRVLIACPECSERFHPNDIAAILDDVQLMSKYEEFTLRRLLVTDADTRWCPAPDCGYAVIAAGCASCPKLKCLRPGCDTYFCYHCKQTWHPNQTCDAARAERQHKLTTYRSSSMSFSHEFHSEIKTCPRCGAFIIKIDDGSCNHMTCAVCGSEFCWLCMKEISDLHYLSPSGCTFWGKKPWSRKKKILWQLGTIVGAPVGIALIATIAVPAIVIGVPVWVGRKIYYRLEDARKHRRNLAIVSGVTASLLVSPILAGLAVGIGVPILLAYVYGVVPISLCRSGGCGLTTTNSGVRFEFEEDNDGSGTRGGPFPGDGHRVANPSIGPSIGEVSLPMTNSLSASGSHLDRAGTLRDDSDRESASNRALAGLSLNGSLCGSLAGPSGFHNRLEVHADVLTTVPQTKRSSLSSESANFSLSDRSGILPYGDDVSTKALCGSIGGNREKDSVSAIIGPLESHCIELTSIAPRPSTTSEPPVHKMVSNCGSPVSSRSVTFSNDDGAKVHHSKASKRSGKLRSRSFSDKIHEHSSREAALGERLSIHSLMTDDSGGELSPRDDAAGAHNHLTDAFAEAPPQHQAPDAKNDKTDYSAVRDAIPEHEATTLDSGATSALCGDERNHRRKSCELALMEGRLAIAADNKKNKKNQVKPSKKRLMFF